MCVTLVSTVLGFYLADNFNQIMTLLIISIQFTFVGHCGMMGWVRTSSLPVTFWFERATVLPPPISAWLSLAYGQCNVPGFGQSITKSRK
jgi:hypothetical protein